MPAAQDRSVLIIGACQAGVQLASTLRDHGHSGAITLIGAEQHAPYQRPPLSKALLHGDVDVDSLQLRSPEYWNDQRIDLVLGDRVTTLTRSGTDGGGVAQTESGREIHFDRLALAVGSRANKLNVPGSTLPGVVYLRDADDAFALRRSLEQADNIVVVGGGFIGLEVAASANMLGKHVTVVLPSSRILARAVGEQTAEYFRAAHERHGVRVLNQTSVTAITGAERAETVQLSSGDQLSADLVIVGIGASPRIELAQQFGLECADGILVDEHALASDGYTVAAGDCANMPNPLLHGVGAARLRLESVNNATEQAKIAAASLLDAPTPYRTIPWFWSDQYDAKLQVAGVISDRDNSVLRGKVEDGKFSVFHYRNGILIAAECVNSPADFMAIRGALLRGNTIPPTAAADPTSVLKKSAVPATGSSLQPA